MKATAALLALALAACSSSTEDPQGPPCELDGAYSLSYTPNRAVPGTCGPTTLDVVTVTITTSITTTKATVAFQGSSGLGCAATYNNRTACRVMVKCDGDDGKGGTSTRQDAWEFNDQGFTGSSDFSFRPAGQPACTLNMDAHGTRK